MPSASLAAPPTEPGLMLRPGNWDGDIGSYQLPAALQPLPPARWPNDGWQRLSIAGDQAQIAAVPAGPRQRPAFLAGIAAQIVASQGGRIVDKTLAASGSPAPDNVLYLRIPTQPLRSGAVALYRFKNGTATLTPMLEHRYQLLLGTQPFAFTVRNGLRSGKGSPYGEGAHYSVEYEGQVYDYMLPGFGWESQVNAIADFDGDSKPDFLITVTGNNSSHEYLLLSTLARPGLNPPSAALQATGC